MGSVLAQELSQEGCLLRWVLGNLEESWSRFAQIEITINNDKYLCEVKTQYGTGYLAVCQGKCLLLLRETCCGVTVHCLKPNYASTSAFSRLLFGF